MQWLWNWSGECFGYRIDDQLWTYDGKHVGNFQKNEVYGPNGQYLGEIMNDDRLITHSGKTHWRGYVFTPFARMGAYARYASYAGYAMYAGYEDFPKADSF